MNLFNLLNENTLNAIEITNPVLPQNTDPHNIPNSYYSKNLFGEKHSDTWNYKFGYVQLNCFIPKPAILKLLLMFPGFKNAYNKNEPIIVTSKGVTTESSYTEGDILFKEEFHMLGNKHTLTKFLTTVSTLENKAAQTIKEYISKYNAEMLITNKFLIIPPGFRNYIIQDSRVVYPDLMLLIDGVVQANAKYISDNKAYKAVIVAYIKYIDALFAKIGKKEGFLRQKLASKIVNTTTRSVIVSNNNLKANEIGIPLASLLQMYTAELAYALTKRKAEFEAVVKQVRPNATVYPERLLWLTDFIKNIISFLDAPQYQPIVEFLKKVLNEDILPNAVVIFKRDPVIHKTSWLAAKPVIAQSNAIELNNLYAEPLGGDYDGDSFSGNVFLKIKHKDKWYKVDNIPASVVPFIRLPELLENENSNDINEITQE